MMKQIALPRECGKGLHAKYLKNEWGQAPPFIFLMQSELNRPCSCGLLQLQDTADELTGGISPVGHTGAPDPHTPTRL